MELEAGHVSAIKRRVVRLSNMATEKGHWRFFTLRLASRGWARGTLGAPILSFGAAVILLGI